MREDHLITREMGMAHQLFRRELLLAADVVRRVEPGDAARSGVVAAHLRLLGATLHHHHTGEDDLIWPLLHRRAPDKVSGHVVAVEDQHASVTAALSRVDDAISAWSDALTADTRDHVATAVDALATATIDHMAYEERHVVPLMEDHVTLPEWRACVESLAAGLDPQDMPIVFGMIMYEADADLIDVTIASMPEQVRSGMSELASRAFCDHATLIHNTATPPRSTELTRPSTEGVLG